MVCTGAMADQDLSPPCAGPAPARACIASQRSVLSQHTLPACCCTCQACPDMLMRSSSSRICPLMLQLAIAHAHYSQGLYSPFAPLPFPSPSSCLASCQAAWCLLVPEVCIMGLQADSLGAEVVQLASRRAPGAGFPNLRLRMGSRVPLDGEELQVRCLLAPWPGLQSPRQMLVWLV